MRQGAFGGGGGRRRLSVVGLVLVSDVFKKGFGGRVKLSLRL